MRIIAWEWYSCLNDAIINTNLHITCVWGTEGGGLYELSLQWMVITSPAKWGHTHTSSEHIRTASVSRCSMGGLYVASLFCVLCVMFICSISNLCVMFICSIANDLCVTCFSVCVMFICRVCTAMFPVFRWSDYIQVQIYLIYILR